MKPPIGFVRLSEAVHAVGQAMLGPKWLGVLRSKWPPTRRRRLFDPQIEPVFEKIATACASDEIAAVYWTITGDADSLDRSVWHRRQWQSYFVDGTVDLLLPLVDEKGIPNRNGHLARCTREIFIRHKDLDRLVAALTKPKTKYRVVSKQQMREMLKKYEATSLSRSVDAFVRFAKQEGLTGHRDRLREVYREQYPNRRAGRPSK